MARKSFTVRRHADGTATFRCGRYVEHIDTRDKGMMDLYEALRFAAITAGLSLNGETLQELLVEAKGLER